METETLILGSESPRRIRLMERLGLPFEVHASGIAEEDLQAQMSGSSPVEIAMALSTAKAEAVCARQPQGLVVAADTVVVCDGEMFGKPTDRADALRMLRLLSGRTHQVVTAVVVAGPDRCARSAMTASVTMGKASSAALSAYADTGHSMDKAGAYGIQGHAGAFVDGVDGCYLVVVGLPLCLVATLLGELGAARMSDPITLCVDAASSERHRRRHVALHVSAHPPTCIVSTAPNLKASLCMG